YTTLFRSHVAGRGVDKRLPETDAVVLGVQGHKRLGAVADATFGGVDDPAQVDGVLRVLQDPQVGDDVTDLLALIEFGATDHLVGHTRADEHLLQRAGGVVGAVHDRHVRVTQSAVGQLV